MNTPTTNTETFVETMFQRVYQHIESQPISANVSLLGGEMGYACLEAYAQRFYGLPNSERLWDRIGTSLAAIQDGQLIHSFASGITGVAWGFLHLSNQGLLTDDSFDPQDIVAELDEPLFDVSMELLQAGDFDYIHGGLGASLYYLERYPTPIIARFIEQIVTQLSAQAIRYPNGEITWLFTDFGKRTALDPARYNLGLAHGTPSIVAILSLFYERGYARKQCAELIRGSLQWLWNCRNPSGLSSFPHIVGDDRQSSESRLAWCYGDLGVANTFWLAGSLLAQSEWQAQAEAIILKTASRRIPEDTLINDAGICHGSAGATHLFRKFANRMHHPTLIEAADYWLQDITTHIQPENQEEVFLAHVLGKYLPDTSLLGGEAGIGLALLAELGQPTHWDRLLLLS